MPTIWIAVEIDPDRSLSSLAAATADAAWEGIVRQWLLPWIGTAFARPVSPERAAQRAADRREFEALVEQCRWREAVTVATESGVVADRVTYAVQEVALPLSLTLDRTAA